METKHHNKLVRDNILVELAQSGIDYTAKVVIGADKYRALLFKLNEEVQEVIAADTRKDLLEELADVIEVCYGLAKSVGYDTFDLESARVNKMLRKGSFNHGDFLLTTKQEGY